LSGAYYGKGNIRVTSRTWSRYSVLVYLKQLPGLQPLGNFLVFSQAQREVLRGYNLYLDSDYFTVAATQDLLFYFTVIADRNYDSFATALLQGTVTQCTVP
jgi:hypothetical protein